MADDTPKTCPEEDRRNGCTYGRDTRTLLSQAVTHIEEGLARVETKLDNEITHLRNRFPASTVALITILSSLVVGLIVAMVKK